MAKYRVVVPGKSFMCVDCGAVFDGMNARNLAARCWDSHHKPPEIPPFIARPRQEKEPGEGIEQPDRNGHWRRVNWQHPDWLRIQRNKALHQAAKREDETLRFWDRLLVKHHEWNVKISPMQRLAYAFTHGGWDAVKQAAIALSYSAAIERKIEDLNIPLLIADALNIQNIVEDIRETMDDLDYLENEDARRDIFNRRIIAELEKYLGDIREEKNDDESENPD